jgi:hypothetical protein
MHVGPITRRRPSQGPNELGPPVAIEIERTGQEPNGEWAWHSTPPTLQRSNSVRTQARSFGEFFLRQTSRKSMLPEQVGEVVVSVSVRHVP